MIDMSKTFEPLAGTDPVEVPVATSAPALFRMEITTVQFAAEAVSFFTVVLIRAVPVATETEGVVINCPQNGTYTLPVVTSHTLRYMPL